MKISSNLGAMLDQDNVLQITCIQHLDGGRALVKIGPEIDIKFFSVYFTLLFLLRTWTVSTTVTRREDNAGPSYKGDRV